LSKSVTWDGWMDRRAAIYFVALALYGEPHDNSMNSLRRSALHVTSALYGRLSLYSHKCFLKTIIEISSFDNQATIIYNLLFNIGAPDSSLGNCE